VEAAVVEAPTMATNQKFTGDEVNCLLDAVEEVLPLVNPMWKEVAQVYNLNTTKHQR
jgi:hypothetical protein